MTVGAVPDGFILSVQIIASGLMGADYFFESEKREEINIWIKQRAKNLQLRAESKWKSSYLEIFFKNRIKLSMTFFAFFASLFMIFLQEYVVEKFGIWGVVVPVTGVVFFVISIVAFHRIISDHLIAAIFSLFVWLMSFFVGFCKKGAIFGVGFLFLLFSFLCRYLNLP